MLTSDIGLLSPNRRSRSSLPPHSGLLPSFQFLGESLGTNVSPTKFESSGLQPALYGGSSSCLEAWSTQMLYSRQETGSFFGHCFHSSRAVIATTYMHCTGTGFCFRAQHLPCIYSSHMTLVSLYRGFDRPPWTPPGYGPEVWWTARHAQARVN